MNEMKYDNRMVIAAMLRDSQEVPDTVGELGLEYVPEVHRVDGTDEPLMDLYGLRDMIERGTFSCGDAAGWESAVLEEKYQIPAECTAVAQGEDDMHGIILTADQSIDPTANFLNGTRWVVDAEPTTNPQACTIQDGRVICNQNPICCVDEKGNWYCPAVPGLSKRRERIRRIFGRGNARWAKTAEGAVVPVCAAPMRRRLR